MAQVVHPRTLDRTRPYGECLGEIVGDVHYTQAGYGFNAQGQCVEVSPEAPDYEAWKARAEEPQEPEQADDGSDQQPAQPAEDGQPTNPEKVNVPAPGSGNLEGFREQDPEGPAVEEPQPAKPSAMMTWGDVNNPPAPEAPAEADSGDGDGPADDMGPLDPEMPWNELQAAMKARGLPRPQNKEDAKRILEEAGYAA